MSIIASLVLWLALWGPLPALAAPPDPISIGVEKMAATANSIADGSRLSMEVVLHLSSGLHSSALKPGYSQVTISGRDQRGYFENVSIRVDDPLLDQLLAVSVDTPAKIVVVKKTDEVGMAWLVVERLELLPVPPPPPAEGGAVVGVNTRMRLTHRADGTPYAEPVILQPNPSGTGMIDAAGEVSGGVALPWGQPRPVEIEVNGTWVTVELNAEGVW